MHSNRSWVLSAGSVEQLVRMLVKFREWILYTWNYLQPGVVWVGFHFVVVVDFARRVATHELQSLLLDVVQFVIQCDDYTGNDTKHEVKCSRDSWRGLPGW